MTGQVEARLQEKGIIIPTPGPVAGSYVPTAQSGSLLFVSGQVPLGANGLEYQGKLGAEISIEEGQAAARLCALNVLAQVKAALGDLDRVAACVKIGGFVNATPDFHEHPRVINGASDLMAEVFGEAGKHARFAVGAPSLPFNVAVEVEAIFEVAAG